MNVTVCNPCPAIPATVTLSGWSVRNCQTASASSTEPCAPGFVRDLETHQPGAAASWAYDQPVIENHRRVISTWYYEQHPAEGGHYAQARGDSSSEAFRDVYRRCICVFFASARRASPEAELLLFVNHSWRPEASPVALQSSKLLRDLNVEIVVLPYSFAPPATWGKAWRNQFYVLDVLTNLAKRCSSTDLVTVLDSDIVWSGSLTTEDMWREITDVGYVTYLVDYDRDESINGLSRTELTKLARELDADVSQAEVISYSGGEFIALRGNMVADLARAAHDLWPEIARRHASGQLNVCEEAHLLSLIYALMSLRVGTGDRYIKRIWTQVLKYRNAEPADLELALWHVPAEKRYGLKRVYEGLAREGVLQWMNRDQTEFVASISGLLGIPRNSVSKQIRDLTCALRGRFRR